VARVDLSSDAIRLTRALYAALPENAEVAGLLALMLLTDARRPARTDRWRTRPARRADRTHWDKALIAEGVTRVRGPASPSHRRMQLRVRSRHPRQAATADQTDWPQILVLMARWNA
jgi:predicted RNA polymerase sigma factor